MNVYLANFLRGLKIGMVVYVVMLVCQPLLFRPLQLGLWMAVPVGIFPFLFLLHPRAYVWLVTQPFSRLDHSRPNDFVKRKWLMGVFVAGYFSGLAIFYFVLWLIVVMSVLYGLMMGNWM